MVILWNNNIKKINLKNLHNSKGIYHQRLKGEKYFVFFI